MDVKLVVNLDALPVRVISNLRQERTGGNSPVCNNKKSMKKYIINPAYYLRMDGNRAILSTREYYLGNSNYQDCTSHIHPFNAQLLTFFDGENTLDEIESNIVNYFGISIDSMRQILSVYIENNDSFSIPYKNNWMFFPKNLIIDKEQIGDSSYSIYDLENFLYKGEPDLDTVRTNIPLSANLLLTMQCYTDCIYCYANRKIKVDKPMNLSQIISIIRQAKEIGMEKIDINGGEVLLHPDYKKIISELIKSDFTPYISTKVPIDRELIQELKELGVEHIQVSLDSVLPSTLSTMLRVDGKKYWNNINNTILMSGQEGLNITIHTILTSYNSSFEEIEALLYYVSKHSHIKTLRFSPAGYSLYKIGEYNLFRSSEKFINNLESYIENNRDHYTFEIQMSSADCHGDYDIKKREQDFKNRALCTANTRSIVILPDGRVTICEELYEYPQFIIGDLTKQSIIEVWNSEKAWSLFNFQKNSIQEKSACKQCNELSLCRQGLGVCWKIILMAYGFENWDFPDPRCPKAPTMYNDICLE